MSVELVEKENFSFSVSLIPTSTTLCTLHSGLIHQIMCSTYNVHATLILTHCFTALPPPTTSPHWPHISQLCPCVSNSAFVSAANKTTSKSNRITINDKGTGWSYGLGQMNSGTSDNKTNSLHGPKCEMQRWWYRSRMYGLFLPLVDSPHKLHSRLSASISMHEMTTESMMYYPGENLELLMQQANQFQEKGYTPSIFLTRFCLHSPQTTWSLSLAGMCIPPTILRFIIKTPLHPLLSQTNNHYKWENTPVPAPQHKRLKLNTYPCPRHITCCEWAIASHGMLLIPLWILVFEAVVWCFNNFCVYITSITFFPSH